MRIEELSPEKFYAVIVESPSVTAADLNLVAEKLKEKGVNAIVLADDNPKDLLVTRYWGIWCYPPNQKPAWAKRTSDGCIIYYPSPALAQAWLDDVGWQNSSVKEFVSGYFNTEQDVV